MRAQNPLNARQPANAHRRVLCVRFFFNHSIQISMQKFRDIRLKVIGFKSNLFRIYKVCGTVQSYRYQFRLYYADTYITICHKSRKCKIFNKITLSAISIIANAFFVPFVLITMYPYSYFQGGYAFIFHKFDVTNVRLFGFVNIFLIVLLSVILFLN